MSTPGGFSLNAPDNDSYMLRGPTAHTSCSTCGMALDSGWVDPLFQLVRRDFEVSYTYDGYLIGSQRFRQMTTGRGPSFIDLQSVPGWYAVSVDSVVKFDAARRKTKFEDVCHECNRYYTTAGATPVFLRPGESIPADQLARTDLQFGTGDEQHPIVLVGSSLAKDLVSLAGVSLKPIAG